MSELRPSGDGWRYSSSEGWTRSRSSSTPPEPERPCPDAEVCQTCDCADDDDVCFPAEREAAERKASSSPSAGAPSSGSPPAACARCAAPVGGPHREECPLDAEIVRGGDCDLLSQPEKLRAGAKLAMNALADAWVVEPDGVAEPNAATLAWRALREIAEGGEEEPSTNPPHEGASCAAALLAAMGSNFEHQKYVYCQGCRIDFDIPAIIEDLREAGWVLSPVGGSPSSVGPDLTEEEREAIIDFVGEVRSLAISGEDPMSHWRSEGIALVDAALVKLWGSVGGEDRG